MTAEMWSFAISWHESSPDGRTLSYGQSFAYKSYAEAARLRATMAADLSRVVPDGALEVDVSEIRRPHDEIGQPTGDGMKALYRLQSMLRAKPPTKHWHGGPQPCRVCGGIAPYPPKREE